MRVSVAAAGGALQRHELDQTPEHGPDQGDPPGGAATSNRVGHGILVVGVTDVLRSVAGRRRAGTRGVSTLNPERPNYSLRMAEPRNDS
jgi:hypothetical protein